MWLDIIQIFHIDLYTYVFNIDRDRNGAGNRGEAELYFNLRNLPAQISKLMFIHREQIYATATLIFHKECIRFFKKEAKFGLNDTISISRVDFY